MLHVKRALWHVIHDTHVIGLTCEMSKEPYDVSKEPYDMSKEPYDMSKVPYDMSKEPYDMLKEPCDMSYTTHMPHVNMSHVKTS